MKDNFKSGFVGFLGRTNVGKSTILNRILNKKVSIVTSRKQTTRTQIRGIKTEENYQLIFLDTPGIHKGRNKINKVMNETAYVSNRDVDVILFVVEPRITDEDIKIITSLKNSEQASKIPVILLINKIDKFNFGKDKARDLKLINDYSELYDFAAIIPISAEKDKDLNVVEKEILKYIPFGPKYYDEAEYTDQTERAIVEETIREKALKFLREEIPHGILVEVDKMKLRQTTKGEEIYDIDVYIYCNRESHKGIIIGKQGETLKKILTYSRQDLENILDIKINLNVWVKTRKDWINDNNMVKRFELE